MDSQNQQSATQSGISENPPAGPDRPAGGEGPSAKPFYGKKNWKKWVVIYVLIGAIIYAGIYYFVFAKQGTSPYPQTPTPTIQPTQAQGETGDLRNYSGRFFSFQYPKDWKIVKLEDSSVTLEKEEYGSVEGTPQTITATIQVYSAVVSSETTLDTWFESRYLREGDTALFALTKQFSKKTTLGDIEALTVTVPGAGGYLDEGVISIYKGRGYHISIGGFESVSGSRQAYNQILSTFTFD